MEIYIFRNPVFIVNSTVTQLNYIFPNVLTDNLVSMNIKWNVSAVFKRV